MTGNPEYFVDHIHLSDEGTQKNTDLVSDFLKGLLEENFGNSF